MSIVGNPIKTDPELKELVANLDHVKTKRSFDRWRTSFLTQLESFLEEDGIQHAGTVYTEFSTSMELFVKMVAGVNDCVDKGDLTVEKTTVKARNALAEMSKSMTGVIRELDELIPQTAKEESTRKYTKFHIGAVLIRQSFKEYGRLVSCSDMLKHMRDVSLNQVADKQILEEMDNYGTTLQKFCDVMADLGLYEVMLKCRHFDMEDDDGPPDFLFCDLKTGGIGELSRELMLTRKILTVKGKEEGTGYDIYQEAATDDVAKDRIVKMLRESTKLGLGCGNAENKFDEENVGVSDAEKISNMWGVKLKKTPKNTKGEEFVFICPLSGAFGEVSRVTCLEKEIISLLDDENNDTPNSNKDKLGEAVTNFQERGELAETIRGALKLGIPQE